MVFEVEVDQVEVVESREVESEGDQVVVVEIEL